MNADAETASTDELLFAVDAAGIARITLNRPKARNALTFAMYRGLVELCERIEADHAIKAVIITGAGDKAFAAGTDIAQFRSFSKPEDAIGYERFMDRVLGGLERLRVPTIAAVAGACTGGGAAIAAACDMRIASRDARFGIPIARTLGNCLSQNTLRRLANLIGAPRVKDILFTARLVEAQEALAIGLVNEVVEDAAAVAARADALATLLASHAPLTLQATKEGLRRIGEEGAAEAAEGERPGDDLIVMTYMSEDFREGMEAFLGKRPPSFKGR
ncbi:enoyl-CoA hydratase/isomerase family protein [Methylorubrum extorquens]|jgi:enoyl-CoA hydratase/carnithine racemase|uniref:enoyl-CoA hydratase/isomerase family protein n=1 Tax=Methylorubrum extorquens TaxID=408 RepID=UPI0006F62989|nr:MULTISPECIES: enoyl-CoA hydratase/isomerase family protein [Methylorubrum]KQP99632.1 enoyl-CoA hydratase [Methylobacterium sp. Leaf121]MDF9862832.1 enoyl-CoA hydratase [Methylorubrum pseudosasae]MDH6636443.1 enoyl-CoA hydratase [Methylobacterium sp. SuP10 SLI 274]ARO53604.1 enoyl-CoA hydratase [Methylorubrum zatmanii]MCG5246804.1 enoyl-CoA hydratase/isomerase family protein [Methylorubrum extorquens]